ncbi:MAG: 6-hydroxycyclohex-1-ene-1-carbonyl-CoA dehydrogenase [Deltaproteobacteria bacterium]|nr:6-hydroxycyclohex-1-ene-1-carbonyl-CoA dehydrogenase [Deltaproteobacteria bacterium]
MSVTIKGWQMVEPGKPLELREYEAPPLKDDDVLVKVAGCGVCHTDISFLYMGVRTNSPPPLTLGHEVSGTVEDAGAEFAYLKGKEVIVPAVLPCGECELCKSGQGNACRKQKMPGNDLQGGFASHLVVPGRYMCLLDEPVPGYSLEELSVVADAVTTPYHAVKKAGVKEGDLCVHIGIGGIGTYAVQVAKAMGAHTVCLDVDQAKLDAVLEYGADVAINVRDKSPRDVKKEISALAKEKGWSALGWRIFETSGTSKGQVLGFSLLTFTGSMSVVGFTMDKVEVRLSNLMAFDANLYGNWGCKPEYYPDVVDLIRSEKITLKPFIETHPLSEINKIVESAHKGKLTKRAIMVPDFD